MNIHDIIHNDVYQNTDLKNIKVIFNRIFNLYDYHIFDNQISDRLVGDNVRLVLSFGSGNYASFIQGHIDRINWRVNLKKLAYLKGDDLIYRVQTVIKYSMLYIAMILWGYMDTKETNERLIRCVAKLFYGSTEEEIDDIEGKIGASFTIKDIKSKNISLPTNWSGSCYLDSLLVALFLSVSPYYRKEMLVYPPKIINYDSPPCESMSECSKMNNTQMKKYTITVQNVLKDTYRRFTSGENHFQCRDIRKLLAKCVPSIIPYRDHFVSDIYAALAGIFPRTQFILPQLPFLDGTERGYSLPTTTVPIWEYIDSTTNIDWDNVSIENLVFQNTFMPIKHFDSTKTEYVREDGEIVGITKAKAFSEILKLKANYRIYAAIMHSGLRKEGAGGHYTVYIRRKDGWYFYNDIGPVWRKMEGLPTSIFKESGTKRPELLFYQRVD